MRYKIPNQKGFTLIEMIVSLAIFMIVAVVAVGSLVRVVALNRQAQTLQSSVNNISFALDAMSREVRQGSKIGCMALYNGGQFDPSTVTSDCSNISLANQLIVFQSSKTSTGPTGPCNLFYAYLFVPNAAPATGFTLKKAQQSSCGQLLSDNGASSDFYPILDDANVKLTSYRLTVISELSNPFFKYKWVFVRLTGYAGMREQDKNFFDIETSISQRVYDI